jgi:hypothetical protein
MKLNGLDINKAMFNGQQISKAMLNGVDVLGNTPSIVTDGLILWLSGKDFKNSPQTTLWMDKSNNNINGAVSGFAYTALSGSDSNGGVVFDGTDDMVNCGVNALFNNSNAFTVEFWMKTTLSKGKIIGNKQTGTIEPGYVFIMYSGKVMFKIANGVTNTNVLTSKVVNDGNLHQVIGVMDKSLGKIKSYVDGVYGLSSNWANAFTGTADMTIGNGDQDTPYAGALYQIRIYGRALSDAEILKNYNASI